VIHIVHSAPISGAYNQEDIVLSERVDAVEAAAKSANTTIGASGDKKLSAEMLARILASLDENKAEEVVVIPLEGKSEMADNMVIASGRSTRQVSALADLLFKKIKEETGIICRMEGKDSGDWVLIDCGDAVVHIFRPEVREFYQLEKMWQAAGGPTESE